MCIKIIKSADEFSYDSSRPIEDQICGAKQIVINYEPKDPDLDKFLDEVERICKTGIGAQMNIKVIHNNHLAGAKAKREALKLTSELDLNEVIRIMSTSQFETDKKLEELVNFCRYHK